jgi:hypothetical protein
LNGKSKQTKMKQNNLKSDRFSGILKPGKANLEVFAETLTDSLKKAHLFLRLPVTRGIGKADRLGERFTGQLVEVGIAERIW